MFASAINQITECYQFPLSRQQNIISANEIFNRLFLIDITFHTTSDKFFPQHLTFIFYFISSSFDMECDGKAYHLFGVYRERNS